MSRQMMLPGASSSVDAEIARVQNEIKALDRSISAQQQKRSALSASLDALLAAKEKSDMSGSLPVPRPIILLTRISIQSARIFCIPKNSLTPPPPLLPLQGLYIRQNRIRTSMGRCARVSLVFHTSFYAARVLSPAQL